MILQFTRESIEMIGEGKKHTTLRYNGPRYYLWFMKRLEAKSPAMLQIWCGNPRFTGFKPKPTNSHPGVKGRAWRVAEVQCIGVSLIHGRNFTDEIAIADGFHTVDALRQRLYKLHGSKFLEPSDVDGHQWGLVTFDPVPIILEMEDLEDAIVADWGE